MKKKLSGIALCVLLVGVLAVSASAAGLIKSVTFNDLNEPFPGEVMDFDVTPLFSNLYEVAENGYAVFWYDETDGADCTWDKNNPPRFIKDHVYRVRIYVEPKDDNEFPDDTTTMTAFINDTKVYVYKDSNGYFVQSYFDPCGTGTIDKIDINIPVPQVGAKPSFEKIDNQKYISNGTVSPERNGIKWYDVTAEKHLISGTTTAFFERHHVYKATFSIETTYNFEFLNDTTATVNDKAAEISFSSPWNASVTYTFDELGCAPEFVEGKFPSCDKTGHVGYFACDCGKWYWDKEATKLIEDKEEIVIPPTGAHSGGTATCKVKAKCTECGKEYGSPKAHSYKTVTTKASLSKKENGKIVSKCSCGAVKSGSTKTVYYPKTIKLSYTEATYNGKTKKPTVTVKDSKDNTLKEGTDYTVQYASGRKNPGKYTITVTFKGKYEGKKVLTLTIKPKAPSISSLYSKTKGKAVIKWTNVTGESGFQVYYATSKDGTYKKVNSYSANKLAGSKTKLKSGKRYYFKVRAYKKTSGGTVYSSWSAVKSVKVK